MDEQNLSQPEQINAAQENCAISEQAPSPDKILQMESKLIASCKTDSQTIQQKSKQMNEILSEIGTLKQNLKNYSMQYQRQLDTVFANDMQKPPQIIEESNQPQQGAEGEAEAKEQDHKAEENPAQETVSGLPDSDQQVEPVPAQINSDDGSLSQQKPQLLPINQLTPTQQEFYKQSQSLNSNLPVLYLFEESKILNGKKVNYPYLEFMYQRHFLKQAHQNELIREKYQSQCQLDQNCTFRPQINPKRLSSDIPGQEDLYRRQMDWNKARLQKLDQKFREQSQQKQNYRFVPEINPTSNLIISRKYQNYAYNSVRPNSVFDSNPQNKSVQAYIDRMLNARTQKQKLQMHYPSQQDKSLAEFSSMQTGATRYSPQHRSMSPSRVTIPEMFQFRHVINVKSLQQPAKYIKESHFNSAKVVQTYPVKLAHQSDKKDYQRFYEIQQPSSGLYFANGPSENPAYFSQQVLHLHHFLNQ